MLVFKSAEHMCNKPIIIPYALFIINYSWISVLLGNRWKKIIMQSPFKFAEHFKTVSLANLTSVISLSDCIKLLLTCCVPQHQPHILVVYSETQVNQKFTD